jgi:hypothetical protein
VAEVLEATDAQGIIKKDDALDLLPLRRTKT